MTLATSIQSYADKITRSWHKAAESIIETGRFIVEAEERLAPDQYRALTLHLVENAGMSPSTISKLRKISRNPVLTSPENVPKLPPSYATLYRLAQVEDTDLQSAFEEDAISTETQLKDVEAAFFKKPKTNKPPTSTPTIMVAFRGDLSRVSQARLLALRSALDALSFEMKVNVTEAP